eukprot:m.43980 g.43980  ORF g.43980 m.43980 type:complete len:234 (+) comp10811_c1_seq1:230-931(+)
MDQEELDRQMSPSLWSHRFDAEEVIDAHCRVLRQETKKSAEMWETELVQYGADATEVMTVYSNDAFKEHNGSAPTVVYIHGGMWQFLSMADSGFAAGPLLEAGCKLVAVEYTIAPAGTMTQMVAQCAKAVAHTVTHVTTGPIYLVGHSAGGHLVAAMLYINWSELGLDDTAQDRIKGICLCRVSWATVAPNLCARPRTITFHSLTSQLSATSTFSRLLSHSATCIITAQVSCQ